MPELPEVHTTATMLGKLVIGLTISDVWTSYNSPHHAGKDNIKDPAFFAVFRKTLVGTRIVKTHRRGKNVLIDVVDKKGDEHTIVVHMKMTGHMLYGSYVQTGTGTKIAWQAQSPEALKDPFNQFIRMMISFSNGRRLALSDVRKFAKVTVLPSAGMHESEHLAGIGPEPLDKAFSFALFRDRLLTRPNGKIKQVLMDPKVVAGIGNIYSDEILWAAGVHPESAVRAIPEKLLKQIYDKAKEILRKGIDFGGDSTSDYRNPMGERGQFHYHHRAYRNTGKACEKRGCSGTIRRIKMGGRSAHFCDTHQTRFLI